MRRSTDRILTTHAGNLPRDDDLAALIRIITHSSNIVEHPERPPTASPASPVSSAGKT